MMDMGNQLEFVFHTLHFTKERLLQLEPNSECEFPVALTISDGLDGSGSQRIFWLQVQLH